MFENLSPEKFTELISTYGAEIASHFLQALLILIVGLWVAKKVSTGVRIVLEKRNTDPTLIPFLEGIISMILKVLVVISAIQTLGLEVTGFVAILGAVGLAIGMALSGTLQNFAGGVMILIFKPFKVGDYIDAQGHSGTVNQIQVFNTILKTPDNKTIIIPNGGLSTGSMVNYSTESRRRVDWTVGIAYGDSTDKAREVLNEMLLADERIIRGEEDFEHVIVVKELADSSVNFAVRAWVEAGDYWGVFFDINEKVYNTFPQQNLNIPFPQMDVHVHQNK